MNVDKNGLIDYVRSLDENDPERDVLLAFVDEVERLRAENLLLAMANADREEMKAELEWFRRREARVRDLRNATISSGLPAAVCFDVFEANNPKPGAGT